MQNMPVSTDDTSLKPEANSDTDNKMQLHYGSFPCEFFFGGQSIAHQVEGGSVNDGKGDSIWDEFSHSHPKYIADRSTADETCDSYNNLMEDVIMLKYLNANAYNFSLSWSRILPEGLPTKINKKGLIYYNDLINTLLENGIEPIVTLYHGNFPFDLLKKYAGGWMNEQLIIAFEHFARICFKEFGDRVRRWVTIAQPWEHSWKSYGSGVHPPNLCLGSKGAMIANTNMLKAHARVYHLYEREFKSRQCGKVGISLSCNDQDSHIQQLAPVLHPIIHGEYPKILTSNSNECCCPPISEDWKNSIKGSFDFLNLQYSNKISNTSTINSPTESSDISPRRSHLLSLLTIIKTEFDNPEILLSCEGPSLASPNQTMDMDRAQYFTQISSDILKALLDECNIKGFFPGKLMDCWEWESGFTTSHGLFHVDMLHPSKKRSPRASAAFMLKQLFKEKKLQDVFPL